MSKRATFISIGVLVVVVAGVAWLLASGRVAVVWKQPKETIVVDTNVCDAGIIGRYNDLFSSPTTNVGEYTKKLKALDDEIGNLAGSDQDANCLYMRYTAAMQAQDYERAKDYVDKMGALVDGYHGQFVTAKVLKQFQPSTLEESLKAIQTANDAQEAGSKEAIPSRGGQG